MNLKLLEGLTLHSGSHKPGSEMCAMEAVAYIAGHPWSDRPECVCPVIAAFVRSWNDGLPNNAERDRLLKPLIPRIIGTRSTPEVEKARSMLALDWYIRTFLPAFLRLCPATVFHAEEIEALPKITEENAGSAGVKVIAASDAAWAAARTAASAAARAAARTAARTAASAAASVAASVAAWDAAWAAIAPTVATLQASASELVLEMCKVK